MTEEQIYKEILRRKQKLDNHRLIKFFAIILAPILLIYMIR